MAFKVKDLMIEVAGIAQPKFPCITGTVNCCALMCTQMHSCFCTHVYTWCLPCSMHAPSWIACEGGTRLCGVSIDPTTPIIRFSPWVGQDEITPLKEQLRKALEVVEKQEADLANEMQPKTIEDVTMLEGKLTDALAAIKAKKAELTKK